jgi:hypothetical protein
MEAESDNIIPFLDVLVIRKGMILATKFTENPPTLANISATNQTIHCM